MELITAINTLPADVLLEIFNVYVIDGVVEDGLDNVGTRVSTLANCRFSITTSPQSATRCVHPKRLRETPWMDIWPPLPPHHFRRAYVNSMTARQVWTTS